jgi:hypothetical protein
VGGYARPESVSDRVCDGKGRRDRSVEQRDIYGHRRGSCLLALPDPAGTTIQNTENVLFN